MGCKIDTHCHIIPSFYRKILEETGHSHVDGMPGIPVRALAKSPSSENVTNASD